MHLHHHWHQHRNHNHIVITILIASSTIVINVLSVRHGQRCSKDRKSAYLDLGNQLSAGLNSWLRLGQTDRAKKSIYMLFLWVVFLALGSWGNDSFRKFAPLGNGELHWKVADF